MDPSLGPCLGPHRLWIWAGSSTASFCVCPLWGSSWFPLFRVPTLLGVGRGVEVKGLQERPCIPFRSEHTARLLSGPRLLLLLCLSLSAPAAFPRARGTF